MNRPAHRARTLALGLGLAGVLGLAACGSGGDARDSLPSTPQRGQADQPGTTSTTPKVTGREVAKLAALTVLIPRPGDDDHLYAAGRIGTITRVERRAGGDLRADDHPLLDIRDQTTTDAERGLLGLAFSADGATIYVSSTDTDGNTVVASYPMAEDGAIDEGGRKVLLTHEQPYPNHNGGNIVLGPDGKLWFGFGDGGAGNDPEDRAPNPKTVLGKLVRFEPGGKPEIVASGLRNPWRFAFDTDGSLWIADVGQDRWEEIDHLPKGQIEGADLGWSWFEGTHRNEAGNRSEEPRDPVEPVFEYEHTDGNCSITGGFPYHGKAIPALEGAYVFADYCAGDVRAVRLAPDGTLEQEYDLGIHVDAVLGFGYDQDGELYVLGGNDQVVKLVPR